MCSGAAKGDPMGPSQASPRLHKKSLVLGELKGTWLGPGQEILGLHRKSLVSGELEETRWALVGRPPGSIEKD